MSDQDKSSSTSSTPSTPTSNPESASPSGAAKPPALTRTISQEARQRKDSDSRWRTSSFSQPGRIIVIAVDLSPNSKNAFDCK